MTGNGDVIEPENDLMAIGSGGPFAQAAAMALLVVPPARGQDGAALIKPLARSSLLLDGASVDGLLVAVVSFFPSADGFLESAVAAVVSASDR